MCNTLHPTVCLTPRFKLNFFKKFPNKLMPARTKTAQIQMVSLHNSSGISVLTDFDLIHSDDKFPT